MPSTRPATGFVSVVLEPQPYGLLITVRTNSDLADPESRDRVVRLTGLPDAVETVTQFLVAWGDRHA
jgi:hypothetical protein